MSSWSNDAMFTAERIQGDGDIEAGSSGNNGYAVDIDIWAGNLARKLKDVPEYMCTQGHPGRISRIPENLREVDVKAYEPYFISFGPYHHGKQTVEPMEKKKSLALKYFLRVKPELELADYLSEIMSLETAARSFYSDIEMESQKFVQMLLLDSMYILATFCEMPRSHERMHQINEGTSRNDDRETMVEEADDSNYDVRNEENTTLLYSASLQHDLFLLENQLPFFVLQKVHALVYGDSATQLITIMKYKVADLLLGYAQVDPEMVVLPTTKVHHLLHLCHMFFHPTIKQESTTYQLPKSSQMFRLGSAVQLYETGVSFRARSCSAQYSLLDISFSGSGKLIMPSLCVDDNTNSLLRNLIALEQMKYPSMGIDVSAYAVLLLHLVTTQEDAQLLRRKQVIQHHLASDKEMMYLVNKLSIGLSFDYVEDSYSLKPVFQELNRYSEHRVPRWTTWLKHRYFNNPWTVISLFAASILLILSVVQTFYAVYSYYHPYFNGHI